jgi:hypothetical protein
VFYRFFGGPNSNNCMLRAAASPASFLHSGCRRCCWSTVIVTRRPPYNQSVDFADRVRSLGGDVTLHTVAGGHHNLTGDETAPWTDQHWEDLGFEALRFFIRHLWGCQNDRYDGG